MNRKLSQLKRMVVFGLCAMILFSMCAFQAQAVETAPASSAENERWECEGFDTPGEAITAFCEALKEYDFDKAISTFAIESYCEHYDFAGRTQRMGSFQPLSTYGIISPAENGFSSNVNDILRVSTIATSITRPLQMLALDNMVSSSEDEKEKELGEALRSYQIYKTEDFSYAELQSAVAGMQKYPDFSEVEISEPLSPLALGTLNASYLTMNNLSNILRQGVIAGASGSTEMGVVMEDKRNIYLVTMNVVKYGDKWYNGSLGGIFMVLMNVEAARQGIIGGPKEQIKNMDYMDLTAENLQALFDASHEEKDHALTDQQLTDFKQEFEEGHAAYTQELQSKAEAAGVAYDPEAPWIEQLDVLKELADKTGQKFYASQMISIFGMSYDEMKNYFAVENLI